MKTGQFLLITSDYVFTVLTIARQKGIFRGVFFFLCIQAPLGISMEIKLTCCYVILCPLYSYRKKGQGSLEHGTKQTHNSQQTHLFHSPQHNPWCLLPRTTFSLCLWINSVLVESDKRRPRETTFYKCQIKSSSSFYYTKPITPSARLVWG